MVSTGDPIREDVPTKRRGAAVPLIAVGSTMFVFGLAVSATFAPEWRVLHVFQSVIYVALVLLAGRRSAWGFGGGFFVSGFWNLLSIVATTATRDGVLEVVRAARTGNIERPDLLLTLFATLGHTLIMIGCVMGVVRLVPRRRAWEQFLAGGVIGVVYLLVIVYIFGPAQAIDLMRHVFGR